MSNRFKLAGVRILGGSPVDITVFADRIAAIDTAAGPAAFGADRTLAADGLVVLPAFVDLHTHLREPGGEAAETIASGTAAAAAGGYSDVFAMANTDPPTDRASRVTALRQAAAASASARVHPVGALTVDLNGRELVDIDAMAAAGVTLLSDDGRCLDDAALMTRALQRARRYGITIAQHAQAGDIAADGQINDGPAARHTGLPPWPTDAESRIVERDIRLAATAHARIHVCHISTRRAVEFVRAAKATGIAVTAEVTPHHLLLTDEITTNADPRYKMNPPLRGASDVSALQSALADGTIDAVATDHAPHPETQKHRNWQHAAFGVTGLETAFSAVAAVLTHHGEPDWPRIADALSHQPARIGSISTAAGRPIAVGEPATFTLIRKHPWTVDPHRTCSKSTNTAFAGRTFTWQIVATLIDGSPTYDQLGLFQSLTRVCKHPGQDQRIHY